VQPGDVAALLVGGEQHIRVGPQDLRDAAGGAGGAQVVAEQECRCSSSTALPAASPSRPASPLSAMPASMTCSPRSSTSP
jgi:hypothetical protein